MIFLLTVGIDIGSITTKIAMMDGGKLLHTDVILSGYDMDKAWREIYARMLQSTGKKESDVQCIISTGYGRNIVDAAQKKITEITCHAVGAKYFYPNVKAVIDIGGQDSKVIAVDDKGQVARFEMNDKCAAGTGRFLEVLTERILNIPLEELGPISLKARNPCTLSSVCTVFAETEIVSLLSEDKSKEDIAHGMHRAIAKRVINMGRGAQIKFREPIVFSGGVAKNVGVVKAIEEELGMKVLIPDEPQITAALGAAILAKERAEKANLNTI